MPGLNQISPEHLMRRIGLPDAPVVLDLCLDDDFQLDPRLIPSSRRADHRHLADLVPELAGQSVILICQKGKKISQGGVALLRSYGVAAEALEGGQQGWVAAGLPLVPLAARPGIATGGTLWVTRARPKIDRIACPWLIRRFLDRDARFLFVPTAEVTAVAERFDAVPFDVDGVDLSHHGAGCSFDRMLEVFGLNTGPLARLADVIRAADTGMPDASPQAAGLLAASVGFSRMYRDDTQQLEAALPLYDALYRWARDGVQETHDSLSDGRGA